MDIDSFIGYIRRKAIYVDIAKDPEKRFHTSNYEWERSLEKKAIRLTKEN